jgi:hypothetical protein
MIANNEMHSSPFDRVGRAQTLPGSLTARPQRCPCCASHPSDWLPIRFGMVAPSVIEQARRGELVLGPINHGRNEPRIWCSRCETRFGRARPELDRFGQPLQPANPPSSPSSALAQVSALPRPRIEIVAPLVLRTALDKAA